MVADGLSSSCGQESEEGDLTGVVGSWHSGLLWWVVADWHALAHVAPPLVGTGVDGGVSLLGDLGLGWVHASLDSVAEGGKVAVDLDGVSLAALVRINPEETVVEWGTDLLGGQVKVEAGSGWRFSVGTGWSSDGLDLAGEDLERTEHAGVVAADHHLIGHSLVVLALVVGWHWEGHWGGWAWWTWWTGWTWITTWTWKTSLTSLTSSTAGTGLAWWTWWTDWTDETSWTWVPSWTLATAWASATGFTSWTWATWKTLWTLESTVSLLTSLATWANVTLLAWLA